MNSYKIKNSKGKVWLLLLTSLTAIAMLIFIDHEAQTDTNIQMNRIYDFLIFSLVSIFVFISLLCSQYIFNKKNTRIELHEDYLILPRPYAWIFFGKTPDIHILKSMITSVQLDDSEKQRFNFITLTIITDKYSFKFKSNFHLKEQEIFDIYTKLSGKTI